MGALPPVFSANGVSLVSAADYAAMRTLLSVYSSSATDAAIASAVAALVNSAPSVLDTLSELATALGNDPNFATTVASSLAGKQPLDSDLTAIAALSTTSFGRGLLELANAAAVRSYISAANSFADLASKPTTLSGYGITDAQPLDSDLTAIAGLSTTSYGRAFLALADQAALLSLIASSSLDQAFSETITWTGTTAPSGTATTRHSWYQIGKLVHFSFRFEWTVAGSALTAAQWPFPSGFPAIATMTGQDNSEVVSMGSCVAGNMSLGGTSSGNQLEGRIQLTSGGAMEARCRFGSTGVGTLIFNGVYRCQ